MDDSAIICDDGMNADGKLDDEIKSCDKINFNKKKAICKRQNFYIWLPFSLITIALLIAVTIYCHLIKHRAQQKHLLPFQFTNNKT